MSQNGNSVVRCPNCGTQFPTNVEQLFDVGRDPSAKNRFLQGQFNLVVCPSCNFQSRLGAPIVYHDPAKQLLLSYIPVELALSTEQKEQFMGSVIRAVERTLPEKAPKGYLLRPRELLSLQGMLDTVLEADGITKDMLEAQSSKVRLIQAFVEMDPADLPAAIAEKDSEIDFAVIELLAAMTESALASGQNELVQRLAALHETLMAESSVGRESQARMQMLENTARELNDLGENLTPDALFDKVLAAEDDIRRSALLTLARPYVDYNFLLRLSEMAEAASGDEKERLTQLRDEITATLEEIDAVARERGEQVNAVLQFLLTSPDLDAAIAQAMPSIDETFMSLLAQNYEAAQRAGREDIAERIRAIGEAITRAIQSAAPPEVRFINQLLSAPDEDTATILIKQQASQFPAEIVQLMESVSEQLRGAGRTEQADKLLRYKEMVKRERSSNLFR